MRPDRLARPTARFHVAGALCAVLLAACSSNDDPSPTPPPDPTRATLGAHALVGQEDGVAATIAQSPPLATADSGSSFIAFSAGYASNASAPTDNLGNAWAPLGTPVVYAGYEGRFDVKAYLLQDGQGGPGHIVSIAKPGVPAGELTMPVVEVRNGGRLVAVARNYAPSGALLASDPVTTDGPALLVAFWWGDAGGLHHTAEPDGGFTVIERFTDLPPNSAVQCVVAVREVAAAGSYSVNWSTAPAQGAPLWLFAFAPAR